MRKVSRFALMAVVAVAMMVPALAADQVTVGSFLVEMAKVKNLPATDGATAAASLKAAGVALPALDVTKALTEADVATIARAAGLQVTTANPSNPFSQGQVDTFMASFGSELGRRPGDRNTTDGADPTTKGKGKKKGLYKTTCDPE